MADVWVYDVRCEDVRVFRENMINLRFHFTATFPAAVLHFLEQTIKKVTGLPQCICKQRCVTICGWLLCVVRIDVCKIIYLFDDWSSKRRSFFYRAMTYMCSPSFIVLTFRRAFHLFAARHNCGYTENTSAFVIRRDVSWIVSERFYHFYRYISVHFQDSCRSPLKTVGCCTWRITSDDKLKGTKNLVSPAREHHSFSGHHILNHSLLRHRVVNCRWIVWKASSAWFCQQVQRGLYYDRTVWDSLRL